MVIDLENLSLWRQFYWPGIKMMVEVSMRNSSIGVIAES